MDLVRSINRWALAGLMVNAMIGSGIFGVPGELNRLVGTASPLAFVVAGLAMAVIIACFVEVASQFSSAGGPYLYARAAFGRFVGLQVAWFSALAPVAAAAAQANLFANYAAQFAPGLADGAPRIAVIVALLGIPTIVNWRGVSAGKTLSSILVIAKLLPLLLLVLVGLAHTGSSHGPSLGTGQAAPESRDWFAAALLAAVCYGGFEDPLATAGEVREPRRSLAFALGVSFATCFVLYVLIQIITVRTIGASSPSHPLAAVASVLLGPGGAALVAAGIMMSTGGAISAIVLGIPRIVYALASNGDASPSFARLHGRHSTPAAAILLVSALIFVLAVSGTYRWALTITAGATMVMCALVCACLIRLRQIDYNRSATHIPFGVPLALVGVVLSLLLVAHMEAAERALMWIVVLLAGIHWLCVRHVKHAPAMPPTT